MNYFKKIIAPIIFLAISIQSIFWMIVGSYYSYPNGHDLEIMNYYLEDGSTNGIFLILNTIDGRYTTNILHLLNHPKLGGLFTYKLIPIFSLLLCILAVYLAFSVTLNIKDQKKNILYALTGTLLFFSNIKLSAVFYWVVVNYIYIFCIAFVLYFYSFFQKYVLSKNYRYLILAKIFLVLAIGTSEFSMVIVGIFLFYNIIIYIKRFEERKEIIELFIIYIASCVLFLTSPGVLSRIKYSSSTIFGIYDLLKTIIIIGLKDSIYIPLILFMLIILKKYPIKFKKSKLAFGLSILTMLLLYLMLSSLVEPASNTLYRVLPVISLISIIPISYILAEIVKRIHFSENWLAVAIILIFQFNKNSINDIKSDYYSGKLSIYKDKMEDRYQLLSHHSKNPNSINILTIDKIEGLPLSVNRYIFLQPNRFQHWNGAYESYFSIDELRLRDDTVQNIFKRVNEINLEF